MDEVHVGLASTLILKDEIMKYDCHCGVWKILLVHATMDNLHYTLTFDLGKIFISKSILLKRAY